MLAQQHVWRRSQLAALSAANQTDSISHRITTQAETAFRLFHFEMTEEYSGVEKQRASILNLVATSAGSYSFSQTLHGAKSHDANFKSPLLVSVQQCFFLSKKKKNRHDSIKVVNEAEAVCDSSMTSFPSLPFFENESILSSKSLEILHSPIYPFM